MLFLNPEWNEKCIEMFVLSMQEGIIYIDVIWELHTMKCMIDFLSWCSMLKKLIYTHMSLKEILSKDLDFFYNGVL